MKRSIRSGTGRPPSPPVPFETVSGAVEFPLAASVNRCAVSPCVETGRRVRAGDPVARSRVLSLHASLSGTVRVSGPDRVVIDCDRAQSPAGFSIPDSPSRSDLPDFAARMGLAGMGGSLFPASKKLAACETVHTLVINAVECEPGIEIDEALFLFESARVDLGVRALEQALGIDRIVMAAKKSSAGHLGPEASRRGFEPLWMSDCYPAGAEKLILRRLEGRMPPTGVLPVHRGVLVMSVASLWSMGRCVGEGRPSIDRPLTLVYPERDPVNVIVPVGAPVRAVFEAFDLPPARGNHVLVAGGRMMGKEVCPEDPVLKGTLALFLLPASRRLRKAEEPCILCGSCFDACPLGLHPVGMADRIRERAPSRALEGQLEECFLCGACSAVCPSEIPLVQYFHEGKAWLSKRK